MEKITCNKHGGFIDVESAVVGSSYCSECQIEALEAELERVTKEWDKLKLCANCEQYFDNTCGQSDSSGCGYCDAWAVRAGLQPKEQGE